MSGLFGRFALAAAFLAAVASLTLDPAAPSRAETFYLAKMVLLVGIAVSAARPRRWGWVALMAVLALVTLIVVPAGPARGVLILAGLSVTFLLAAMASLAAAARGRLEGRDRFALALALAFGMQVLLRPELGLSSPDVLALLVRLLLGPALAAGLFALLTAYSTYWLAAAVMAFAALLGPGWTPRSLLLFAVLVGLTWLMSRQGGAGARRAGAVAGVLVAPVFLASALLAAYPWGRNRPLAEAARRMASGLPRPPALVLLEGGEVALDVARPEVGAELADPPASELAIDSRLANAAALPAGTVVATFRLVASDGAELRFALRSGVETGEWAARRRDVASLPGFVAPPAFRLEVAPDGASFGSTYRARWQLPAPTRARRIEVARWEGLPANVVIAITRVEIRP